MTTKQKQHVRIRKGKLLFAAMLCSSLCLFTSCGHKKEEEIAVAEYKQVVAQAQKDYEKIKKASYQNLESEEVELIIPEAKQVYSFLVKNEELEPDKYYEEVCKGVNTLFQDNQPDKKLQYQAKKKGEIIDVPFAPDKDRYIKGEELAKLDGETTLLMYEDKEKKHYYMLFPSLNYVGMNRGKGYTLSKSERDSVNGWFPDYDLEVEECYEGAEEFNDAPEYQLADGAWSIADAVAYTENYINHELPYPVSGEFTIKVQKCEVMKVNEEIYGYRMALRRNYEGLDVYSQGEATSHYGESTDEKVISADMSEAFMVEKEQMDFFWGLKLNDSISDKKQIEKGITVEGLVSLLSKKLSGNVTFKLKKIELVYCPFQESGSDAPEQVRPYWYVQLENNLTEEQLSFFVDFETGEEYYYYTGDKNTGLTGGQ